jgi:hypothetical protein
LYLGEFIFLEIGQALLNFKPVLACRDTESQWDSCGICPAQPARLSEFSGPLRPQWPIKLFGALGKNA